MWMFYADNTGYIPMGNDGQMKVPSNVRTGGSWKSSRQAGSASAVGAYT